MISLKRWKRRKPDAEFSIGARCIDIRPVEPSMGAGRIGIRAVEGPCPLICAVAVETAKTHGTTQLRRMNFFQFIILWVSKKLNRRDSKVSLVPYWKGNAVVTFADCHRV